MADKSLDLARYVRFPLDTFISRHPDLARVMVIVVFALILALVLLGFGLNSPHMPYILGILVIGMITTSILVYILSVIESKEERMRRRAQRRNR